MKLRTKEKENNSTENKNNKSKSHCVFAMKRDANHVRSSERVANNACDIERESGEWTHLNDKMNTGNDLYDIVSYNHSAQIVWFSVFHEIWSPFQDECQIYCQNEEHRERIRHKQEILNSWIWSRKTETKTSKQQIQRNRSIFMMFQCYR